jgi:LacI family transcriptional regulator
LPPIIWLLGAIQALRDHGLRVPEDISVVTFDDLGLLSDLHPFLTVVSQPAYDFGMIGVKLLLDRMKGNAPPEWRKIILQPKLIIRRSTCPAPPQDA